MIHSVEMVRTEKMGISLGTPNPRQAAREVEAIYTGYAVVSVDGNKVVGRCPGCNCHLFESGNNQTRDGQLFCSEC